MAIRSRFKDLLFDVLRSLNPRYYIYLADRRVSEAVLYLLGLLVLSFVAMAVIALPQVYLLDRDIQHGLLDIPELGLDVDYETAAPVLIPRSDPLLVMDTTGNYSQGEEVVFFENRLMRYQILGQQGEINMDQFDFTTDRAGTRQLFWGVLLAMLPSVFFFYFLAFTLKYALTVAVLVGVTYPFQRIFRNITTLSQSFVLAMHTATVMIVIEILTIPFSITDTYLVIFPVLPGVHFSLVAITIWLILYATAVRITGNQDLR